MDADFPPHELVEQVRNALAHLYDYAYLQNHPLAIKLATAPNPDQVTRAQALRRALLDALEALHPRDQPVPVGANSRAYTILTYRYVDGLTVEEIIAKLALSRRQFYRDHAKGIEAVTSVLMAGHATLLLSDQLPTQAEPAQQERMALAHAEVDRLRQTMHWERVNLNTLLDDVCTLLAPRFHQTGVTVTHDAPTTESTDTHTLLTDRTLLRQALLNLVSYALDTVTGRGDLRIAVESVQSLAQKTVSIRVQEVPKLDQATSGQAGREEVGLAVAIAIVAALGGELTVATPHQVWQAHLWLPSSAIKTILVVDDNATLAALIQRYLGGHQLTVVSAHTGDDALHLARQIRPHLILLDIMMPGHDGWEILAALTGEPAVAAIPIVICSVLQETELARAMGASDYLAKPFTQLQLLTVLRRWLGTLSPAL